MNATTVRCRAIGTADPVYPAVLQLRDAVLRQPLGQSVYNDDLSKDEQDAIFIAEAPDGALLGCVLLHPLAGGWRKLRQMAVRPEAQGQGVGAALVRHAEAEMTQAGCPGIELNARAYALPFYEKLGYATVGDAFTEVGIPHFRMEKTLS